VDNKSPAELSSEVSLLITRNVDVGSQISAATIPKLTPIMPFQKTRAVWVTCGGACFDARAKSITAGTLCPVSNQTFDVMYP